MIQHRRSFPVFALGVAMSLNAAAQSAPNNVSEEPPTQPPNQDSQVTEGPPPFPLPPPPRGKSSVIGGEIVSVNAVRDQFRLKIFGGKTIPVLYDERTQIYRDGVKAGVLSLQPYDHASVETTLDGTRIFALRIHMLSQIPQGHCLGAVSLFNPQSGELTIGADASHHEIKVIVPPGTPVLRTGQAPDDAQASETFNFAQGLQVDVTFKGGSGGRRVATQVNLPASRGSGYAFSGSLIFLDLHSRVLMVSNARDHRVYEISFDPVRFPLVSGLHEGTEVSVSTNFDGSRFVANGISVVTSSQQ